MQRMRAALLAALVAVSALSACQFPLQAGAGAYPMTMSDGLGREVRIVKRPQRFIAGAPNVTEILFAIGLGAKTVGVSEASDWPPEAASVEKIGVGHTLQSLNLEKVVALRPDIFFAIGGQAAIVPELERLGITVFVLEPRTVAEIMQAIRTVGEISGNTREAQAVAAGMQRRLDAVAARVARVPEAERPRVFWEVWNNPLYTAGKGTFAHELITLAGGLNVAGDVDGWPEYSLEVLVKQDPQVIITTFPETVTAAPRRAGWAGMAAVKDSRITLVDANLVSRPGPRIVDALEALVKVVHPNLPEGK